MTRDQLNSTLQSLTTYHRAFPGGVEWRLCSSGIEVNGTGVERTAGEPQTVAKVWKAFSAPIMEWSKALDVPAELIVATICVETNGDYLAIRKEPGFADDHTTPSRISAGLMQTLVSTAREVTGIRNLTRTWLLVPENAIRAGTGYIARQSIATNFDPPKVAAAYNAGGVYRQLGVKNRWRMRQFPLGTGEHVDRFVKWFNDFYYLIARDNIQLPVTFYDDLQESV